MPMAAERQEIDQAKAWFFDRPAFAWCEAGLLAVLEAPGSRRDHYQAALGLRDCGTPAALPALRALLHRTDPDTRRMLVLAVAHLGGADESAFLGQLLLDENFRQKEYVLWALYEIGDARGVAAVVAYLSSKRARLDARSVDLLVVMAAEAYLRRHAELVPDATLDRLVALIERASPAEVNEVRHVYLRKRRS